LTGQDSSSTEVFETVSELLQSRTGVHWRTFDLAKDLGATERLAKILDAFHLKNAQPPLVYGCNRVVQGFKDAASLRGDLQAMLTIEVFVRAGCPRCANAKTYLPKLARKYPGFEIKILELTSDAAARKELELLTQRHRTQAASVPVFHLCNQLLVGFDREETTGKRIEAILDHWTQPIERGTRSLTQTGLRRDHEFIPAISSTIRTLDNSPRTAALESLTASTIWPRAFGHPQDADDSQRSPSKGVAPTSNGVSQPAPQDTGTTELTLPLPATDTESLDTIDVPFFGKLSVRSLGLPVFTIAIGLVDGFNPCAMWVLVFLLSVLVNLHDRWKILAVAGSFVFISGFAYFAFMAAWLNVFALVGLLRPVQITLGLLAIFVGSVHVKDFFAFKQGLSFSIPESAKPGIYAKVRRIVQAENLWGAITGACVLAVLVNIIELLCTAGLPALYAEVLAVQQYPTWKNYLYLALYNLAYMFDDSIMVGIVVITLGRRKMQEKHGRWLKLLSGSVILTLGLVMLFCPEWLV
jgi:glutaredoxin